MVHQFFGAFAICGQRKEVSAWRARIAHRLCREMGISMAEADRKLGVGTLAIAMTLRKKEQEKKD